MKEQIFTQIGKLFQKVPTSSMSKEVIIGLVVFGVLLIFGSLLCKYIRRKTKNKVAKKMLREFPTGMMMFGIVALVLVWMRLETVLFLSMRLWWVFYWVFYAIWILLKIRKLIIIKRRIVRAQRRHK